MTGTTCVEKPKRRRRLRTVSGAIRSRRDTSVTECPSAHSHTIRDR